MLMKIENLRVEVEGNSILNGIDLDISAGNILAIMGPNGSGKSTLVKAIAGHPSCQVTGGSIQYNINGKMTSLSDLEADQRSKEGIFLGFQYPVEIPGISNLTFLHEAFNNICLSQGASAMEESEFRKFLRPKLELLEMDEAFLDRGVNTGFSGGEKKKNEILQMAVLAPRLGLLDEVDSGLDIDALKIVAKGINALKNAGNAIVLVTHYQRLLEYVVPDTVCVLRQGKIVHSGGRELALELEQKGYDW